MQEDKGGNEGGGRDVTDKVMEAMRTKERLDREKEREAHRDKSHDGRLRVGENTSIGGKVGGGGASVDVKHTF